MNVQRYSQTARLILFFLSIAALSPSIAVQANQRLSPDELLRRSLNAMGGSGSFTRLDESWIEREVLLQSEDGTRTITTHQMTKFPDSMTMIALTESDTSFYRYKDGHISASTAENTLRTANEGTTSWFRGFYWREWWVLYARFAKNQQDDVTLQTGEPIHENGRLFHVLHVEPHGAPPYTLHIEDKSWRPAKRLFKSGESDVTDLYSDFEEHDGILFPMTIKSYVNGEQTEDILYSNISFLFNE